MFSSFPLKIGEQEESYMEISPCLFCPVIVKVTLTRIVIKLCTPHSISVLREGWVVIYFQLQHTCLPELAYLNVGAKTHSGIVLSEDQLPSFLVVVFANKSTFQQCSKIPDFSVPEIAPSGTPNVLNSCIIWTRFRHVTVPGIEVMALFL